MPNRWLAIAISAFWAVMMTLLVERDVLPHWRSHQRPDFRAIAAAEQNPEPVRWAVIQGDQRVGTAETQWRHRPDGWSEFHSQLDLQDIPFLPPLGLAVNKGGMRWQSAFNITPDGDLDHFEILIYWGESNPTMKVLGRLNGDIMKVAFRTGDFTHEEQFYYEPHSLLTASLSPIDKLPNLSVGQTWEYRVMNPLMMKGTEIVRCEVTREQVITWRGDPVPTYLVEEHYGQIRARCWVAHDGTVLRQEVPLGWNPLVLEHE